MIFKRNNILKFINFPFIIENIPLKERITVLNNKPINDGKIIYLMTREFRFYDNLAINYTISEAKKHNLNYKVLYIYPKFNTKNKQNFFQNNFLKLKKTFLKEGVPFEEFKSYDDLKISTLITDFNPLTNTNYKKFSFKVEEIDGHNIIPSKYISNKQEYNAMTFRRKVYKNIGFFLNNLKNKKASNNEAKKILNEFILSKLDSYNKFKNDPSKDATSNLSAFINYGFISAQRVAIEIIKSKAQNESKEAFLEELIVRKELAENFCLYCKNYKELKCLPNWAKITIKEHKNDFKSKIYSLFQLENALTEDDLWNACQIQLIKEGKINRYLRMYWAKMILKWSTSNYEAIKRAIYLNDKYAFDAPSTNGYTSILWAIGGLHDRAFMERPIFGKIRIMTQKGISSKFNINEYIKKYQQ